MLEASIERIRAWNSKAFPATLCATLLLSSSPAFAQSAQTPELQALGTKLMQEINANIQCNANAISGRQEIEKLQAEIKALKAKYEPEVKPDAK